MIVFPDVALTALLDGLIAGIAPWVHLYMNDYAPTTASTLSSFDELDVSGYVPQEAVNWTPALLVGREAQTSADPLSWTRGSSGTSRNVYGYFVTDGIAGPLLWAQRGAAAPYSMLSDGDQVMVIPRVALGPCGPVGGSWVADAVGDVEVTVGPVGGSRTADAVGDVEVSILPPPSSFAADAVGDVEVTVGPVGGSRTADAVGDVEVTVGPVGGSRTADAVGDVVVTLGPPLFSFAADAVGDVEVTVGPVGGSRTADAVGDVEES